MTGWWLWMALFPGSNPVPLKAAMASLSPYANQLRLPLVRASAATEANLAAAMAPVARAEEQTARRPVFALASGIAITAKPALLNS
jgi:hypothetical protein